MDNFSLTDQEKNILLQTARDSITSRLLNKKPVYRESTDTLKQKCGAFVTLHKNGNLRGCIGHLYGIKPLFETVKEMALSSAFEDPRFPSVKKDEIDDIEIEISVLTPMEKISSIEEIETGKHGIFIRKGFNSGTLLPQVPVEQGWDRETFIRHACLKAGLRPDAADDPDTDIYVYSAIVFSEKK